MGAATPYLGFYLGMEIPPKRIKLTTLILFYRSESSHVVVRFIELPKSYFLHFYIFASLYISFLLYICVDVYVVGNKGNKCHSYNIEYQAQLHNWGRKGGVQIISKDVRPPNIVVVPNIILSLYSS